MVIVYYIFWNLLCSWIGSSWQSTTCVISVIWLVIGKLFLTNDNKWPNSGGRNSHTILSGEENVIMYHWMKSYFIVKCILLFLFPICSSSSSSSFIVVIPLLCAQVDQWEPCYTPSPLAVGWTDGQTGTTSCLGAHLQNKPLSRNGWKDF